VETEALGNLFLVKAVESLHSLAPDNPQFWCYLHRYLEDLSVAYLWEIEEHHRRFKNFDARDVRMAADRSAPLNVCVATLALYADKEHEIENVTEAMRQIIFGLQIRDDLTDWREDFRQGNWTYPINLAIEQLQQGGISFNPQSFQEHEIENALFLSDIVERLFEESTINFQLAKEKLAHLNSKALCEYLDAMIANNEKTKMATISAKMQALLQWDLIQLEETCSDKNLFQT
jgi:hypothetical protein